MSTPVLEINNLRKSFGDEVVLQNISLSVPVHTATVLLALQARANPPYFGA